MQGATYQPTAWPVPHVCAQPYQAGSGSHIQLFLPHWGLPAWQSRWVDERRTPASQKPLTAEVRAKESIKRHLHTTHVLDENRTAILPRHVRYNTETHSISGHVSLDIRPYFVMNILTWGSNINSSILGLRMIQLGFRLNRLSINVRRTNLIIFQFSSRQNKLNQSKTIQLQQNYITFDQT